MDLVTFKNAVHAWFSSTTGLTCVWARQVSPVPASPFGMLSTVSNIEIGTGETEYELDEEAESTVDMVPTITTHRQIIIQCQVMVNEPDQGVAWEHDDRADHYLNLAEESLRSPEALETLRAANISHVRTGAIIDLSDTSDGSWTNRATMDVTFGATGVTVSVGTGYINKVKVSGDFTGTIDPNILDFTDEEFGG